MGKKMVAIDGPAGAGKSTVARLVAQRLNYLYIDTGAMYRAITYQAMTLNISVTDHHSLTYLANKTDIKLINEQGQTLVFCNGHNITEKIRTPEVSNNVSLVALVPGVRKRMVELQRQMARESGVVMDGRDIGTEVLPNADCKIFLTASVEERAQRRYYELKHKGYSKSLESVKSEIIQRDLMDTNRDVSPLIKTAEAYLIDSSGLTVEQVVNNILKICKEGDTT
jgi:cytidylate kinase